MCSNLVYFECSLIFGLFGTSHVDSKIKHAKVKQTPKIKTPNSTIVNCYENYLKQTKVEVRIADLKRANSAGITVSVSVLFCSVSYGSNSNVDVLFCISLSRICTKLMFS
jgi:hypothetical protein